MRFSPKPARTRAAAFRFLDCCTAWCVTAREGTDERPAMIIVLKPHPTPEVVQHVLERIEALGLTPHLSQGVARTIIGVIGDEEKLQVQPLQAIPGVEQVVPILKPFKLASREFHRDDLVIDVKGVRIGGGHLAMIAGPCVIESEPMLMEVAGQVKEAGASARSRSRT